MVAGGSNSLVLSAACHCYVFPRTGDDEERRRGHGRPEESQINSQDDDTWIHNGDEPGEHVPLDERIGHDSDRISQQTVLCGTSSQTSPGRNGESLGTENFRSPEDDHLIPMAEDLDDWEQKLRELSQSKLKWGAMPLPNDLAEAVNIESGEIVMHLGFGDEFANIRSPQEGGLYV
ncbi:hypothetical protein M434DRAFT_15696 [Hypoxylon sp. CO27-5]|nr:hypothetical protein M434DRAFT_15696 [Hypoxylon sp. CO27-5]